MSGKVKRVAKIRISNKLDNVEGSIENAPFFRRKMEKAEKFLVVAGCIV